MDPGASGGDHLPSSRLGAVRWASTAMLATTAVLLAALLVRTGGTFVYVIDDPAIHLTVARRLALDGTWGIVPGEFQAASSSPLWTLLLAPTQWVLRGGAGELVPLALATAAGLAVVGLLGADLAVLRPARNRPLDALAAVAVPVLLLALPALAFTGMEHTLHAALALAAALAVERGWGPASTDGGAHPAAREPGAARARRLGPPLALLAAATLVRGETAFLAAGLGAGLLVAGAGPWRRRLAVAAALGVPVVAALGVVAAVNVAFGQDLLPNSVMLKTFGDRGDTSRSPVAALERLTEDPLLAALAVVAVVALVVARRGGGDRLRFAAVTVAVATGLHVVLGAVDGSLRYEAYLVAVGVWVLLRLAAALGGAVPAVRPALVVLALVPFAVAQARTTVTVPRDAAVLTEQRYQVARFVGAAYDGEPVAISELGYIGLYHDGPLTDVYGLGDYEVAQARIEGRAGPRFWERLQGRRCFRMAVAYPFAFHGQEPPGWIHVATWRTPQAYYPDTVFWATVPGEVEPLRRRLEAFEPALPDAVEVSYNNLAGFAAAARADDAGACR